MTTTSISVRLQRLISTPSTTHADWRPTTASPQTGSAPQILELAVGDQTSKTICVQQHRCTSHPLPPDTIMLTASTCQLLRVSAGASLRVTPVTLHRVHIDIDARIQQDTGAISLRLATMLGVKTDHLPDLILCPPIYTTSQQNMRLRIAAVREEKQQGDLIEQGTQKVINGKMESQNTTTTKETSQKAINTQGEHPGAAQREKDDQVTTNIVRESRSDTQLDPASQSGVNVGSTSQNMPQGQNQQPPITAQESQQAVMAQPDRQAQIDLSPRIWLKPEVASALGVPANSTLLLYIAPSATDGSAHVQVMQHPGFCYLSPKERATLNIEDETVIELRNTPSLTSHVQLHPLLEEGDVSFVDETIADHLQIAQRPMVTFTVLPAKLYWLRKEKVDDIRNKARVEVRLSQEDFNQGGYIHQESVRIFSDGTAYMATIESTTQSLPEGFLTMTSFLLRQAKVQLDQGVFLSTDHASFLLAKVGILNVDEISSFSARGSDRLSSLFKMPCLVELRNPQHGANLDILLEPDPYPRKAALVRMSRTTRQMLLLERGQQVLVRPIPQTKEAHPIRATLLRLLKAPFYRLLLLLIHRRRVLVSIAPAHTWDDQAQVARVDAEALAVLGMSEGDRLLIRYRGKSLSRVTLANAPDYKDPISMPEAKDEVYNRLPKQFQIGLDAVGRYKLGNGSLEFGTVVEVERDMSFILQKSLNLALLPIIGTVVAVLAFLTGRPLILQIMVAAVLASLFFYLALSVERSKVK